MIKKIISMNIVLGSACASTLVNMELVHVTVFGDQTKKGV